MKSLLRGRLILLLFGLFVNCSCQENGTLIQSGATESVLPKANVATTLNVSPNVITLSPEQTTHDPNLTTTLVPETSTANDETTTTSPSTTSTVPPNSTTTSTTPSPSPAPTPTPTPTPTTSTTTPATPVPCHHFDWPSFIGGIVLTLGLLAIGIVAYKFYNAHTERNYRIL